MGYYFVTEGARRGSVGAGSHIGIPIVKAFLAIGTPILVIARLTSTNNRHTHFWRHARPECSGRLLQRRQCCQQPGLAYEKLHCLCKVNWIAHSPHLYCSMNSYPWLTTLTEAGKFHIINKGDMPGSFTAIPDVAGYMAHSYDSTAISST
ncbi:hypothetical protein DFH29DRAFT_1013287 [Suillus ampliporus]|nr:hypothetical protein DFH29DRAFT_1013287 [Suillus ampliporus]